MASICEDAHAAYSAEREAYTYSRNITHSAAQVAWGVLMGAPVTEHLHEKACDAGDMGVIRHLTHIDCPADVPSAAAAARNGNLRLMNFLRWQKAPIDYSAAEAAAEAGHFQMFKGLMWLTAGDEDGPDWLCAAVKGGNEDLIRDMLSRHYWGDAHTMMHAAGKSLKMVRLLLEDDDCGWDERAPDAAAEAGHVDVLAFLMDNGCPIDPSIYSIAAERGHGAVMQWAKEEGIAFDAECFWRRLHGALVDYDVVQFLVEEGHLDTMLLHGVTMTPGSTCTEARRAVRWMNDAGAPMSHRACEMAAREGNLQVLITLRSLRVEWDERVCTGAAEHAHLHVLKWAITHGCPYSGADLTFAALTFCNMAITEYLNDKEILTRPSVLGYEGMLHVSEECFTQRLSRWLLLHGYE
ncbi:hypothetical protein JKP88DRAFT_174676 [Tribonema minus]|uniref:Ankyrin repeat protein n=1 Tax=Tribonema minus TaxID=303371 RepID=A0A835ZCP1_9STRA|nr:hypothetical protein JKP88DRAFT_174676 [Tribonema minus]